MRGSTKALSLRAIREFRFPAEGAGRRDVARFRRALRQLGLQIADSDAAPEETGGGVVAALRQVQVRAGLPVTGEPDPETVARIRLELESRYFTGSKTRTARLHEMLGQVEYEVAPEERRRRVVGASTEAALRDLQRRFDREPTGLVDEQLVDRLRAEALAARLSSKRQRGMVQQMLLRAVGIARLDAPIERAELKSKTFGPSSRSAIEAFQHRYGLPVTGEVDPATYDKLRSVAASRARPAKTLKVRAPERLSPIRRQLRLNMTNQHVADVQRALAFLGHSIEEAEFGAHTFGRSTRAATLAYQRANGLPPTGHVDRATLDLLNREIRQNNPVVASTAFSYRIRGTVRDQLWQGVSNVRVQVRERVLRGEGQLLAERRTLPNGFFDIPYNPPRNPATKQVRKPFHLLVTFLDGQGLELGRRALFNPPLIAWANLTQGDSPYRGGSEFEARMAAVVAVAGGTSVGELKETEASQEVTQVALATGLDQDEVMQLVLAHLVAGQLADAILGPPVCYAYIRQSLPPNLPDNLLASTDEWTLIDQLVDQTASGLVFTDPDLQAQAFDNAVTENLIPIAVGRQRDAVLAALASQRQGFALDKPILVGNGSLRALLGASTIPTTGHPKVANAFLDHRGFNSDFWSDLQAQAGDLGGAAAVADLETTVTLGQITRNHQSTLSFLKATIAGTDLPHVGSTRDLAKLTHAEWVGLIRANGGAVPPGTDGGTPEEQVQTYARTLAMQSEALFPTVAFAAEVGRSGGHGLPRLAEAQLFIDGHAALDLRTANVDRFVSDHAPSTDPDVVGDLRVMQRVHRLVPTATAGRALLEHKLHSSAQIVGLGKERLVEALRVDGIDQRAALTIHAHAETQYAQVLMRLAEYRFELHQANPRAIVPQTFTAEEATDVLGEFPDLEVLFGSLDYCDCAHCQSVYGPAAYFADLLRWLEQVGGASVRDVLFDRRPDLSNIKLNCENTETPLPYVDLVCEILETAVPAPAPQPDFTYQTTRSAAELRAFPENVRHAAYDQLRDADFPLSGVFDLWQEEARTFLAHLGVPRYELMRSFRLAGTPTDVSVAGEFFGISSHETSLIVTTEPTSEAQNRFWGFDTTRTEVSVSEFLRHARIEYRDLLALLQVQWLALDGVAPIVLDRPGETCSLDAQKLTGLTVAALDRAHRLLRLWRHTGWAFWQLDLLLRAPGVGAGTLDGSTLVALYRFRRLTDRLDLPFDTALCLYRTITTETRTAPENPDVTWPSLYEARFGDPAVVSPADPAFVLPLPGTEALSAHQPALLAGLGVTESELRMLLPRTGPQVTLENLSALLRLVTLARGLRIPLVDLLTLLDLCADPVPDPFVSPAATAELVDCHSHVASSGFTVPELDYLLNHRPDSPFGLRDEAITEQVEALRESLRGTSTTERAGQIVSQVASTFALTDRQAATLLGKLVLLGLPVLDQLGDEGLTARDAQDDYVTDVTPDSFPEIYASWRLLHKVSMVLARLRIDDDVLGWLLDHAPAHGVLDFSALPVTGSPAQPLVAPWRTLVSWVRLRAEYPEPEGVSLTDIIDRAATPGTPVTDVRDLVETLTTWPAADLAVLDGDDPATYSRIDDWLRLRTCFIHLRRLGVDASEAVAWVDRDDEAIGSGQQRVARQVRRAARSKYDEDAWPSVVTPLQDQLREGQRDALIDYLVEHSQRTAPPTITIDGGEFANPAYWQDSNDLLSYFLIDVEMSACQLTSRIKQAISSVQMYVDRCLMNLEAPFVVITTEERADAVSLDSWRQWRWMKSYRMWEANRKVFLYPENWIEPELRDDKTPFFVELEDELLRDEITTESCEAAFGRYLQKVHEVSRLTVVGIYHEVDDDQPFDNLPPNRNILHVVGRTRTDPAQYYYRQFDLNYGTWTPWEKIDLDITGDHVVPVVYNRRLHLFWLIFTDKAQKVRKQPPAKATKSPTDPPDPQRMLEIQLAWTVRKDGGWTARHVGQTKLIHPWERPPSSYNLKPRYGSRENQLWLDVYISTSRQFNNAKFYDPYEDEQAYKTDVRFDETARPWHSSSFVFDGEVVATKLKPLPAATRQPRIVMVRGPFGILLPEIRWVWVKNSTSLAHVRENFGDDGRAITELNIRAEGAPRLALPDGMHFHHTRLTNNTQRPNRNRLNVLRRGQSTALLTGAQPPFELAFSQHRNQFDTGSSELSPLVHQDMVRAHFIRPEWQPVIQGDNQVTQQFRFAWFPFHHPYTALFIRELNRSGVDGLLNRKLQRFAATYAPANTFGFTSTYRPTDSSMVDSTAESDTVDFSPHGAYSGYNWEIFFHAPMLIAAKLNQNQRFEEAMQWYHRIFDPTNTEGASVPQRYWITRPFFEHNSEDYRKQRIEELLNDIGANLDQVRAWKNNPFQPHLIARHRPVAYQKAVVMKYIDNLIDWGDQLFRRDTMESINEATLRYVLAYELLGPRPTKIRPAHRPDRSYGELVADEALDPFGNARVDVLLENFVGQPQQVARTDPSAPPLPRLDAFYFRIPTNDTLLGYWDTVEDRLFKVRHCMNIGGVVRQLPLFEPPIDPAVLVKAAAAGVDLSSVLSPGTAEVGQYRFGTLAAKAAQLCGEVRALGDRLLGVLERHDAESLALLRSAQEVTLTEAVRHVRRQQVDEAERSQEALEKGMAVVEKQIEYYGSIPRMNAAETAAVWSHRLGLASEIMATVLGAVAGTAPLFPQVKAGAAGFGGSPTLTVEIGGMNVADSAVNFLALFQGLAGILHQTGGMLSTQGGYTRQDEANTFQREVAEREREQLTTQIEAAGIRGLIAGLELDNHDLATDQLKTVDEFLRTKYTNQQLYDWMLKQLSTVYFQSYQLAYDLARRAEKCFQFELASTDTFIEFGYWDSLKKGLLAADRLANDLHRMEVAYLDQHRREFELTKHVSLAQTMPLSLLALKTTGSCAVRLPEWLFDLDHPGHYRRRIKSVAVTIPCVVGPYTNVNCTLSLTNNGVRLNDDLINGYGDPLVGGDTRFARNPVSTDSIATSHGVNDRGVFDLRFTDERYLPFEGAGAVSDWQISLPPENNQFDLSTIADVVLHVDYTAVPGRPQLADAARQNLDTVLPTRGSVLLVLNQEFGTEWNRFLHPGEGQEQRLAVMLRPEHLPFWARVRSATQTLTVTDVDLVLDTTHDGSFDTRIDPPGPTGPVAAPAPRDPAFGGMPHVAATSAPGTPVLGEWQIQLKKDRDPTFTTLQDADLRHAYLVLRFGVS